MWTQVLTRTKPNEKWCANQYFVENPGPNWFAGLRDGLSSVGIFDIIAVTRNGGLQNTMGLRPDATVVVNGTTGPVAELLRERFTGPVCLQRPEPCGEPVHYVFGDILLRAESLLAMAQSATDVLTSSVTTDQERWNAWSELLDVQTMTDAIQDDVIKLLDMAPKERENGNASCSSNPQSKV